MEEGLARPVLSSSGRMRIGTGIALRRPVPGRKILVLDDEATIRFAMTEYLSKIGYLVDAASEREEAEALLCTRSYAVVIADLHIADEDGGDGLDVISWARERSKDTRIILLSAFTTPQIEARAITSGANAVLRKPMPLRDIGNCIGALLENVG
jgi:DNA-binding response OmpR family regulator